jgi:superfamily II DNA or RNA helicase
LFGGSQIVVTSVQTQVSGETDNRRMNRFKPEEFSLLIVDESHHCASSSYRTVIDHYRQNPKLRVLGVTATPDRHDKKAMGQVFDVVAYDYEIRRGIDDGWLVPIDQQLITIEELDVSYCRTTAGDLNGADLSHALSLPKVLVGIATETMKYAEGRKTLMFSDSVCNASKLTDILNNQHAGCARLVTGKTPRDERHKIVSDYRMGEYPFLVNVGVATEGFDVQDIACVAIARPTKSRALYAQMIGRGTRTLAESIDGIEQPDERRAAIAKSEKTKLLVLDFIGNSGKHKLIHVADVLGGKYDDEVIALANRKLAERSGDAGEALDKAAQEIAEQRKRKSELEHIRIAAKVKSRASYVDPFDVIGGIGPVRVASWSRDGLAVREQLEKLSKWRIPWNDDTSYAEAEALINWVRKQARLKLATYNQCRVLKKFGFTSPQELSFAQASIELDRRIGGQKRYA